MSIEAESKPRAEAFATSVVRRLTDSGHRALFAGGCVRDRLLGRVPKDFDVATSAHPAEVQRAFPRTIPVGAAFGVILVVEDAPPEGETPIQVEVATFRRESGYADGRHPGQVDFTDEREDVLRRDFTVNGLLFDPLKDELLDYVGGRADLVAKIVRAIGNPDERFSEDRLRLLRAVRFAAQLDFELEPATREAVRRLAPQAAHLAAERIRDELSKMLTGPNPRRAFEDLKSTGLLAVVLPEVDALAGVSQPPEFHPEGDVWTHTLMLLGQLRNAPPTLAWGALLHDIGKPPTFTVSDRIRFNEHEKVGARMAAELLRRLRFPNETAERIVELVAQHMVFKDAPKMRPARLKRFLRQPHFDEHLDLHRIDCSASSGDLSAHAYCTQQLAELPPETLRPVRLLTGDDLLALGVPKGPRIGAILAEVEDLQLEGTLTSREDALEFVRKQHGTSGPA